MDPHAIGFKPLKDFFERGGKERLILYKKNPSLIREVLKNFKNCPIEIRFTPELPIVTLIGDKKIASIMICRSNDAKE